MSEVQTPEMAEFKSRLDRIEVTMSHVVDTVEKVANAVNQPQKTQWGTILTAVGLLFVAGGGYTTLITMPTIEKAAELREENQELRRVILSHERDLGRIEGRLGIAIDE